MLLQLDVVSPHKLHHSLLALNDLVGGWLNKMTNLSINNDLLL